jgi:hypothetical protein
MARNFVVQVTVACVLPGLVLQALQRTRQTMFVQLMGPDSTMIAAVIGVGDGGALEAVAAMRELLAKVDGDLLGLATNCVVELRAHDS